MDKHTIKCDTEIGRNQDQVNNIKPIYAPNPKEKQGTSQWSRQFYYKEKFLWLGVPQKTA